MRDRVLQARKSIEHLSSRRSEAKRADDFRNRAEALQKPAERLSALCKTLRVMRAQGVSVTFEADRVKSLRGQVESIRQEFTTDPESILAPDSTRQHTFWKPLASFPDQVEKGLRDAWRDWVVNSLPGGEPELLKVLERFPPFRQSVREIRAGTEKTGMLSGSLPTSNEPFQAVAQLAETLSQAWARVQGANVSPNILTFLRRAAARQATLADVTPEIINWIRDNDLLESFQVSVGGAGSGS